MKKSYAVVALLSLLALGSCGTDTSSSTEGTINVAMLTDAGTVTDGSYNQTTWEAIQAYKSENSAKVGNVNYYSPSEAATSAYITSMELAIDNGYNVIVCPGYYFADAFDDIAKDYPDVTFIGLDFTTSGSYDNVATVNFKENESGVLAGYAAVVDGYRELGFFGGMAQPAPIRYGLGYVYGAYYAAKELGLTDFEIDPEYYWYCGSYLADPTFQTKAASWYTAGVEVIFTAAGGAGDSAIAAASAADNHMIIGVDTDESKKSTAVITSAMKGLKSAVYYELDAILADTFTGGNIELGIADDACDIVLGSTARFKSSDTVTKTEAFIETLKAGTVTVPTYTTSDTSLSDFKTQVEGWGYTVSDELINAIKGTSN